MPANTHFLYSRSGPYLPSVVTPTSNKQFTHTAKQSAEYRPKHRDFKMFNQTDMGHNCVHELLKISNIIIV